MSDDLTTKTCTPCRGGIPPMTVEEAERWLASTPGWELTDAGHRIERRFDFIDFKDALAFVNEIGQLAESEGHHPSISFGWGWVTVHWYTHKIRGLHENDFIMAAKTNALFDAAS